MDVTQVLLFIAVLIILLLLFFILVPYVRKQRSDTPDDTIETPSQPHPFDFSESPDNQINEQIVDTVNSMGGFGDGAEDIYQDNLEKLRSVAEDAVSVIVAAYNGLLPGQYLDRWSLIQLLTDLKHPSSIIVLDEILSTPIPPEQSEDTHSFTTVGEEVIIRTTAIEALAQLSGEGNRKALDILLKHTRHDNFSVKRASIQAYLAYGGEEARAVLLKHLPESDFFILDIHRIDVRQVLQPQAEKTLKQAEVVDDTPRIKSPKPTHEP